MSNRLELVANFKVLDQTSDEGKIFIEGYANTATKDRVGDYIPASAWKESTLKSYLEKNPILLFNHKAGDPIGQVTEAYPSENGLYIKAWTYSDRAEFKDAQKVKDGVLRTFSVHFDTDWSNWEYSDALNAFVAKAIDDLYEISIVSIPANADSTFSVAKSLGSEFENFKKSHTKPTQMEILKTIKSLFAKAKSGDLTENEKTELKTLINDPEIKDVVKGLLEEDVVEEVVEPTEAEKALKSEVEKLKNDLAAEKLKHVKSVDTSDNLGEDPNKNKGAMSEREKQLEASAAALRSHKVTAYA